MRLYPSKFIQGDLLGKNREMVAKAMKPTRFGKQKRRGFGRANQYQEK